MSTGLTRPIFTSGQYARIGFFLSLVLFVILKIPTLNLPYFWDELGVYAPGSLYMFDHGPGLLPGSLDPEYSRGHPLLFYFLASATFRVFGPGILVAHLFSLCISVLFLLVYFHFLTKWLSGFWAWMASLLLMAQPLFFAQSGLLLPEMLLALCMLLAVGGWIEGKKYLYVVFSFLAIMTKETAVILPLVVLLTELADSWIRRKKLYLAGKDLLLSSVPWFGLLLFSLIQKQQHGWYFFPYHMDLMTISLQNMWSLTQDFGTYIFISQGRWTYSLLLLTGGMFIWWKQWNAEGKERMLFASVLMVLGGLGYSTLIFYMGRYTLFILPFYLLLCVKCLKIISERQVWMLLTIPVLLISGLPFMQVKHFRYDTDMGYVKMVKTDQEVMNYTLSHMEAGEKVFSNFPLFYCLLDARLGYYDSPDATSVLTGYIDQADWVIKAEIGPDLPEYKNLPPIEPDTVFRVLYNDISIYQIKRSQFSNEY